MLYFWWRSRRNLKLIILGSERVKDYRACIFSSEYRCGCWVSRVSTWFPSGACARPGEPGPSHLPGARTQPRACSRTRSREICRSAPGWEWSPGLAAAPSTGFPRTGTRCGRAGRAGSAGERSPSVGSTRTSLSYRSSNINRPSGTRGTCGCAGSRGGRQLQRWQRKHAVMWMEKLAFVATSLELRNAPHVKLLAAVAPVEEMRTGYANEREICV